MFGTREHICSFCCTEHRKKRCFLSSLMVRKKATLLSLRATCPPDSRRGVAKPFDLESFDPELMAERLMAERPVEGNAEPRFFEAGRKQAAEKTSP